MDSEAPRAADLTGNLVMEQTQAPKPGAQAANSGPRDRTVFFFVDRTTTQEHW